MPLTISVTVSENNRHLQDVTTLLFKDEKLYSAAEDGIVKVWDPHLRFLMELRAHESVVFHLATIGDTLYTCSNDGTIKAWDIDTLEHKKTLLQYDSEVWRFFAAHGRLYAGDVKGIAHEMIINTLCPEGDSIVYSGGYDAKVKKWDMSNMKLLDSCDISRSISALSIGSRGQVYVAGSSGYIARLDG